jgi:hypothetical protein
MQNLAKLLGPGGNLADQPEAAGEGQDGEA